MTDYVSGLQLAQGFYQKAVKPIIDRHFPNLSYSAALIGFGSDVLGYDTPMSRDHMWGPRLQLFLPPDLISDVRQPLDEAFRRELQVTFGGYPTNFDAPDEIGVRLLQPIDHGPVNHLIEITTIERYFYEQLGVNVYTQTLLSDWLAFQEHRLLSLTAGKVFHDHLGLEAIRARLAYYPHDLWLYLLAAQWKLIAQEEPFMGRTGDLGDELGSRVITGRLVERIMRLCFLMEKRYAPYSKWFGTAFKELKCYPAVGPLLENILHAANWRDREQWLTQVYQSVGSLQNALGVTPPVPVEVSSFHDRPFQVLHSERFAEALLAAIQDESVRRLPPFAGSVNQFLVESSDVLQNVKWCRRLRNLYSAG